MSESDAGDATDSSDTGDAGDDATAGTAKGTALVTGGSRGIGYELARLFAGTGHDVVLVARTEEDLRAAADHFEDRFGVEATVLVEDLSDPDAPDRIHEACEERDLTVDVLVNNAGFGTAGEFVDTDLDRELDQIQVNVAAVTHLTKLFAREMADRGEGRILNVASGAGFVPGHGMAVYHATKAYVVSFSEAIAGELRDDGVTVTCLCPGPVDTGFQDRTGEKWSTAKQVLSSDARSVARAGYRGLERGEVLVVPGFLPKLAHIGSRLVPRAVTRKGTALYKRI